MENIEGKQNSDDDKNSVKIEVFKQNTNDLISFFNSRLDNMNNEVESIEKTNENVIVQLDNLNEKMKDVHQALSSKNSELNKIKQKIETRRKEVNEINTLKAILSEMYKSASIIYNENTLNHFKYTFDNEKFIVFMKTSCIWLGVYDSTVLIYDDTIRSFNTDAHVDFDNDVKSLNLEGYVNVMNNKINVSDKLRNNVHDVDDDEIVTCVVFYLH